MWLRTLATCCFCLCLVWGYGGCEPGSTKEPAQEKVAQETVTVDKADGSVEKPVDVVEPVVDGGAGTRDVGIDTAPEPTPEPALEPVREAGPEPSMEASAGPDERMPPEPTPEVREVTPENQVPRPGFGAISGMCGVLDDTEWKSTNSFLFRNAIDLGMMGFDQSKLTKGGQKIWTDGNLGGSSVHSEVFAYELLQRCELAKLLKSEGEIKYKQTSGKKTDLLVEIDGRKVGVSVTRAFHFPRGGMYTENEATSLLSKKLKDVPLSAANADPKDAWVRSVLHILAYNKQHADVIEKVYQKLDAKVKANVILMVTVTDGKDDYIY